MRTRLTDSEVNLSSSASLRTSRVRRITGCPFPEKERKPTGLELPSITLAIRVTKSLLKLTLNIKKSELNDPLNKAKDIGRPHNVIGLTELHIKEPNEIQYVLPFIQQSYNRNLTW